MECDESPASQVPIDDEPVSSPVQGEVFFQEDSQREAREFLDESDLSPLMKVSTAELLTQEPTNVEKDKSLEVVGATEIIDHGAPEKNESAEKGMNVEIEEFEDDGRQVEEMEDVQPSVPLTQKEMSVSIVENSVGIAKSLEQTTQLPPPKEVVQSTIIQSQTLEPSQIITTPDNSQQSKLSSTKEIKLTPPILSTQPPSYLPERYVSQPHQQSFETSPPKATPATTLAPASAQIQVKETPLPEQAQRAPIPFTSSTTRISATAPSPAKEPIEQDLRRRYKRDHYIGPIIPRFSRRERKMNCDLEAMLLEDLKRFGAHKEDDDDDERNAMQVDTAVEEVVKESFEAEKPATIEPEIPVREVQNATYGNPITEEIVETRFKAEKSGTPEPETSVRELEIGTPEVRIMKGIVEESAERTTLVAMESKTPRGALQTAMQGDKGETILEEAVKESLETNSPWTVERKEEIIMTRVKNVAVPSLNPQLDDTEDDSQSFDPAQSRWGRFATHWRRFSSSR